MGSSLNRQDHHPSDNHRQTPCRDRSYTTSRHSENLIAVSWRIVLVDKDGKRGETAISKFLASISDNKCNITRGQWNKCRSGDLLSFSVLSLTTITPTKAVTSQWVKRQTSNSAEIEAATDCSALRWSIFMDTCGTRSLGRIGRIFTRYVIPARRKRVCRRSPHIPEMETPSCNW